MQLWRLLEKQVKLYTSGESSSVPELTAHRLLSSICFTLDVDLDDPRTSRVKELLSQDILSLFEANKKELGERSARVGDIWKEVCLTTPLLESIALKDTLESLKSFSVAYDYRYFAHEIPSDIDYPLCHPVSEDMFGVSYIEVYLGRLLIENHFMQQFDLDRCQQVLKKIHPEYRVLLINLYEPIAINAIGLAVAEEDICQLSVSSATQAEIKKRLEGQSRRAVSKTLEEAAAIVCKSLGIETANDKLYLKLVSENLCPRVVMACKKDAIGGVFQSFDK